MLMRGVLAGLTGVLAFTAAAFSDVPRVSADALGVTKNSRLIDTGIVFINGKFLPPPYTVARWGTGLRVNGQRASGQVIAWDEFLKTQSGVKVEKPAASEPQEQSQPQPVELAPEPGADDDVAGSLDDLFDDDLSKKKVKPKPKRRKTAKSATVAPSYSLSGDFVPNAASKALVAKINAARSEIDRTLRMGGFVLFGDGYSRISGDARTAERMMETLPGLLQKSESAEDFAAAVRDEHLLFLNGAACDDLYRSRIDYLKLREHCEQMKRDREWKKALNGGGVF